MAQAFYDRFSRIDKTEAFSTDAVFTQFSKTNMDYTSADCVLNPSSGCDTTELDDIITDETEEDYKKNVAACQCLYKEKVDQLGKYAESEKRSQKSLDDSDEEYAALGIDILNMSIGISIMLLSIYYMNE
jgi:hypothetical protein